MRMIDIIDKKRDGKPLTADEIHFFVSAYTAGTIPDYQVSALLMAIIFQGMDRAEIVALTIAMAESGDMLDLSDIVDYAVDKHSSGGVGDKTSLVVLPLVAAFDVPIAKMSGRGLGFTGGTLDKLEAIAGFNVNLSEAQFRQIAKDTGLVLAGQSKSLAPADGKLYALRDVTGTVASLPLMASSIMSKKLAAGASGIVLDVKVGHGAFMKTLAEARELATIMVQIGVDAGRDMIALLSDMNQPLGVAVGNSLEVVEAIQTLNGEGPADFEGHCVEVAAQMLKLAGQGEKWAEIGAARENVRRKLHGGAAFERFRQMVDRQGGDVSQADDVSRLPQARIRHPLHASQEGYIADIFADKVGLATLALGAGRATKADTIVHAVGIKAHASVGDAVSPESVLLTIHANSDFSLERALKLLEDSVVYSDAPVDALPLFHGTITGDDV